MSGAAPLREEEIRPEALKQGQAERFAADIKRLLTRKSEFVRVPCPACGTSESDRAFEKFDLTYVTCRGCATLYVNPRPTPAILESYYANSENYAYWNKYIFPASESARREKIFRPRAERLTEICRRFAAPTGLMLEVGSGFGTFCEEIKRIGLFERVIAVEPTPDLARTCRNKGLEVIEKPIEQVTLPPGEVSVIASFEVIEHLFAPRGFLESAATLLQRGGLLVLSCPNVKGFDVVTLADKSDTVDVEHLNYFHPTSLARLVKDVGLEVLEVVTPGKLDAELVRKKILAGEYAPSPILQQLLVDEWDRVGGPLQEFLSSNLLSSHMWLVARKPS